MAMGSKVKKKSNSKETGNCNFPTYINYLKKSQKNSRKKLPIYIPIDS